LEYVFLEDLDIDFLEYDLHELPFYKIEKKFYFGGVKKALLIPISMPHRVIVEANPPRQGYHSSWSSINSYYLQKLFKSNEYSAIMKDCRLLGCKAHSLNRSENGFVFGGKAITIFNMIVIFSFIIFTMITEIFTFEQDSDKSIKKGTDVFYTAAMDTLNNVVIFYFAIAIASVFLASFYNWLLAAPEKNICEIRRSF